MDETTMAPIVQVSIGFGVVGAILGVIVGMQFQNLHRNMPLISAAVIAVVFFIAAKVMIVVLSFLFVGFLFWLMFRNVEDPAAAFSSFVSKVRPKTNSRASRIVSLQEEHRQNLEEIQLLNLEKDDREHLIELQEHAFRQKLFDSYQEILG